MEPLDFVWIGPHDRLPLFSRVADLLKRQARGDFFATATDFLTRNSDDPPKNGPRHLILAAPRPGIHADRAVVALANSFPHACLTSIVGDWHHGKQPDKSPAFHALPCRTARAMETDLRCGVPWSDALRWDSRMPPASPLVEPEASSQVTANFRPFVGVAARSSALAMALVEMFTENGWPASLLSIGDPSQNSELDVVLLVADGLTDLPDAVGLMRRRFPQASLVLGASLPWIGADLAPGGKSAGETAPLNLGARNGPQETDFAVACPTVDLIVPLPFPCSRISRWLLHVAER